MSKTPEQFEKELQDDVDRLYAGWGPDEDYSEPYGPYLPCTDDDCPCEGDH